MDEIRPRRPLYGSSLLTHYEYVHSSPTPPRRGHSVYERTTLIHGRQSPMDFLARDGSSGRTSRESYTYSEGYTGSPILRRGRRGHGTTGSDLSSPLSLRVDTGDRSSWHSEVALVSPLARLREKPSPLSEGLRTPDRHEYISKQFPGEGQYRTESGNIGTRAFLPAEVTHTTAIERTDYTKTTGIYNRNRDSGSLRMKGDEMRTENRGRNQADSYEQTTDRYVSFSASTKEGDAGAEKTAVGPIGTSVSGDSLAATPSPGMVPEDPVQSEIPYGHDATTPLFDYPQPTETSVKPIKNVTEEKPKDKGRYFGLFQFRKGNGAAKANEKPAEVQSRDSKDNTDRLQQPLTGASDEVVVTTEVSRYIATTNKGQIGTEAPHAGKASVNLIADDSSARSTNEEPGKPSDDKKQSAPTAVTGERRTEQKSIFQENDATRPLLDGRKGIGVTDYVAQSDEAQTLGDQGRNEQRIRKQELTSKFGQCGGPAATEGALKLDFEQQRQEIVSASKNPKGIGTSSSRVNETDAPDVEPQHATETIYIDVTRGVVPLNSGNKLPSYVKSSVIRDTGQEDGGENTAENDATRPLFDSNAGKDAASGTAKGKKERQNLQKSDAAEPSTPQNLNYDHITQQLFNKKPDRPDSQDARSEVEKRTETSAVTTAKIASGNSEGRPANAGDVGTRNFVPPGSRKTENQHRTELNIKVKNRRGQPQEFRATDDNADLPAEEERESGEHYKNFKLIGFIKKPKESSSRSTDSERSEDASDAFEHDAQKGSKRQPSRAERIKQKRTRRLEARTPTGNETLQANDATRPLFDDFVIIEGPEELEHAWGTEKQIAGTETQVKTEKASDNRHRPFSWFKKQSKSKKEENTRTSRTGSSTEANVDSNVGEKAASRERLNKFPKVSDKPLDKEETKSLPKNLKTPKESKPDTEQESKYTIKRSFLVKVPEKKLHSRLSRSQETISRQPYDDVTRPLFESPSYISTPTLNDELPKQNQTSEEGQRKKQESPKVARPDRGHAKSENRLSGDHGSDKAEMSPVVGKNSSENRDVAAPVEQNGSEQIQAKAVKTESIFGRLFGSPKRQEESNRPEQKLPQDKGEKNMSSDPDTKIASASEAQQNLTALPVESELQERKTKSEEKKESKKGSGSSLLAGLESFDRQVDRIFDLKREVPEAEYPDSRRQLTDEPNSELRQEGDEIASKTQTDSLTAEGAPVGKLEAFDQKVDQLFSIKRETQQSALAEEPEPADAKQNTDTEPKKEKASERQTSESELEVAYSAATKKHQVTPKAGPLEGIIQKYRERQEHKHTQFMESPYWHQEFIPESKVLGLGEQTQAYHLQETQPLFFSHLTCADLKHQEPSEEIPQAAGHGLSPRHPSGHSPPHAVTLKAPNLLGRRSSDSKEERKTFFSKGTSTSALKTENDAELKPMRESSKSEELLYERLADTKGKYSLGVQASGHFEPTF